MTKVKSFTFLKQFDLFDVNAYAETHKKNEKEITISKRHSHSKRLPMQTSNITLIKTCIKVLFVAYTSIPSHRLIRTQTQHLLV